MTEAYIKSCYRTLLLLGCTFAVTHGIAAQVKIESPATNSTVSTPRLRVVGTAVGDTRNIGVVVNDVPAMVDIDHAGTKADPFRWVAEITPPAGRVQVKARLYEAKVTSPRNDNEGASTVNVDYVPRATALSLSAVVASGIAPFNVTFMAAVEDASPLERFEIDYDEDGKWDYVSATLPANLGARYATTGLKTVTARAILKSGVIATDTLTIQVQSFQAVNRVIKEVWTDFRKVLAAGNLQDSLAYFVADSVRAKYKRPLESIQPSLRRFADGLATINAIWIRGDAAHYLVARVEDGRTRGYHVYFARDASGLWKIVQL